jgi:PilZ domain
MDERRRLERKKFSYYMRLIDSDTQEMVGHLADISTGGFKMDSQNPIPLNKDFRLRMDLTSEIANKPSMIFVARSKWCEVDPLDPFIYNVGFQLVNISPGDIDIFNRMMEKYGTKTDDKRIDPRRTNRW